MHNRHKITVTITGITGGGKTNIAAIIAQALERAGVETEYDGADFGADLGGTEGLLSWAAKKADIEGLKERGLKVLLVERATRDL